MVADEDDLPGLEIHQRNERLGFHTHSALVDDNLCHVDRLRNTVACANGTRAQNDVALGYFVHRRVDYQLLVPVDVLLITMNIIKYNCYFNLIKAAEAAMLANYSNMHTK